MNMQAMYGLYDEPGGAQRAFNALKRVGVRQRDITVISSEPFEAFEFSHRDHSLILFRLAGIGGVIGFVVGLLLTTGTELAWPINTGGMPIVAWWPNLIVIFELTMLGAILTTVISLLVTSKLPSRLTSLYDPEVSDGKILVGVTMFAHLTPDVVQSALSAGGALAIRTREFHT
jgi:hypothetical protein